MSVSHEQIELIVTSRDDVGSTAIMTLDAANGGPLPPFTAGAHIDLYLPNAMIRQYSLCSDPDGSESYQLGILLEPQSRGGSACVHSDLHVGFRVMASVPRNHFPLTEDAPHIILAGGGIGITPVLAMAKRLHRIGASFELHYCARSGEQASFTDMLAATPFADKVSLHLDDGAEDQRFVPLEAASAAPTGTHIYTCGPTGFMNWLVEQSATAGIPPDHIHVEHFSAEVDSSGGSFTVRVASSGQDFIIPEGRTIADILIEAGVPIELSCEQGVCGACVTTVLEGLPDHRDIYLMDDEREENRLITPCCSRSKTPLLILDL